MYLRAYDSAVPPDRQFIRSLDLLAELAVDHGVEIGDVFKAVGVDALITLIGKRKLTYWLLLSSTKFKAYLMSLPVEERDRLAGAINVPAAIDRFKEEAQRLKDFGQAAKEAGL
jgi:hypothetical protein